MMSAAQATFVTVCIDQARASEAILPSGSQSPAVTRTPSVSASEVNSSDFSFADDDSENSAYNQSCFLAKFETQFNVLTPENVNTADSLFAAVVCFTSRANAMRAMSSKKEPYGRFTIPELRILVADIILKHSGVLPKMESACEFKDGFIRMNPSDRRNTALAKVSLADYCAGIKSFWGGGLTELYAVALLFKLKIKLYELCPSHLQSNNCDVMFDFDV